jgi:hypothetical protein
LSRMNYDGSNVIQISAKAPWAILINSQKIVILSGNCWIIGNCMYSMNKDWTNEVLLDQSSSYPFIDELYAYYTFYSSWYKTYKIKLDWTNKTLLKWNWTAMTWWIDTNNVYTLWGWNYIYALDKTTPAWYEMTDGTYVSSWAITNTWNIIKIKTSATLPAGTSYTFELANFKSEQIILPEGDSSNYLMWSNFMVSTTSGINVWDVITLYKGSVTIPNIVVTSNWGWMLSFSTDSWSNGSGWGIKKWVANYTTIPNASLDGATPINLTTVFWSTGTELYYRINLATTDSTKTPVIAKVEMIK